MAAESRARRADWFDWLFLLLVAAMSMMVMGPLLLTGKTLSGGDGLFTVDQLQYLSWVRDAGDHILIANRFDFAPDHHVVLHPGYLISGLLHRYLGIGIPEAYTLVWKPVAVITVFFGIRQYCGRLLEGVWARRTAMLIALATLMGWSTLTNALGLGESAMKSLDFISSEMWTGQLLMGYEMGAIAVFMLPLVLLGIERFRDVGGRGLYALVLLGSLLVSWLQPWQGAELAGIVILVEGFRWWRRGVAPDWRLLGVLAACLLPAIYYAWIASSDASWKLAGEANRRGAQPDWKWPLWAVALTLSPLGIPALLSLRRRVESWQDIAVRMWPIAVLVVYLQPFGTFPYHSFQGLALPLSIMAVQAFTVARPAWLPAPRAWWVVPALLLLVVPGTVHRMQMAHKGIGLRYFPYYVDPNEAKALDYLDRTNPGKVMTDPYGGMLVPAFSGQEAFVGPRSWSPHWQWRADQSGRLFLKAMTPAQAQSFLRESGANAIFVECLGTGAKLPSLAPLLGPLLKEEKSFGCSSVYLLKQP
jgi:hypothetical protein